MQLHNPLAALVGGVEADILAALVRAEGMPMDAAMLARLTGKSYSGVRYALRRLVLHGTVAETRIGSRSVFTFNAEHLLAPWITEIVASKAHLLSRLPQLIEELFLTAPTFSALFGSAARDEMAPESDIDIFLVRPDGADPAAFSDSVDALAHRIARLTGNDVRPLVYGDDEAAQGTARHPVLAEILRDGIVVTGDMTWFRRAVTS